MTDRLQSLLQSDVSSGSINAADQSALSGAINDIGTALSSQATQGQGPPAPGQIKNQINSLIANEVQSGKLTAQQGDELSQLVSQAGHRHGHHHHGGIQGTNSGQNTDPSQLGAQASSSSDSSSSDPLTSFLQQLASQNSSYSSDGSSSGSSPSLLVNFKA